MRLQDYLFTLLGWDYLLDTIYALQKGSLPIWPFCYFCGKHYTKETLSLFSHLYKKDLFPFGHFVIFTKETLPYLAITITKKLSLSSHLFIMPEKEGYILCSWFLMGLHWSIIVKAFENVILMVLVLLKCAEILALLCAWVQEFYTYLSIRNFLGPQPSGLTCVYPPG